MTPQKPQILQRVADFIASQELLSPTLADSAQAETRQIVYVGLSGGPDSVALLHILHSLGYRCQALHCNFHLRGTESDRDEQFCRKFCETLSVPLQIRHFDTYRYMKEHHLSLEMAARELRYRWWNDLISESHTESAETPRIALGHHQDDSIENLLMNLMRGTGIQGLTGIVPYNESTYVIRPLLCLYRSEILDYLLDNDLSYVIDSTNLENDTLRNQLRNQLLPLMEQILPQTRQGIVQTIQHLLGTQQFAKAYLDQFGYLTRHFNQWGIEWDEILLSDVQAAIPKFAEDYLHFWEQQHKKPGYLICRDAQRLYTIPDSKKIFENHRPELIVEPCSGEEPMTDPQALCQLFDADTITLPLSLRRYQKGDRMTPLGLNGHSKLLSDIFQNAHFSPVQKASTWLVTDAKGVIVWVIGLRISELHKVTPSTKRQLRLRVH